MRLPLLPLPLLPLLLLACGGGEPPQAPPAQVSEGEADAPRVEDDPTVPLFHARRLKVTDQVQGAGPALTDAATEVVVHLRGRLTGGYVFADTRKSGKPLTFAPGQPGVVVGLTRGIQGMKVGGKRELIVPPEIGFRGKRVGRVPPFSTLIYEVELLRFR